VKEKQENQPIFTALIGILSYYYGGKDTQRNKELNRNNKINIMTELSLEQASKLTPIDCVKHFRPEWSDTEAIGLYGSVLVTHFQWNSL